jgi:hypothetical protein
MSLIYNVIADIVAERQPVFGDSITNLDTGRTFVAEIEAVQDIELNEGLGRDPRESIILHVADREAAAECIAQKTLVRFSMYGVTATFKMVRRQDNPASSQVEFGCVKVVEGKDNT